METYKKSLQIPILISCFISIVVLTTLFRLKDTPNIEHVLYLTLLSSLGLFGIFLLYFFISQIFQLFSKTIWLPGIPIAIIIYFGILIISLSYYKELVDQMEWDISMMGLGLAVIAIGITFLPRSKSPQPEEILIQLKTQSDDLSSKLETLSKMQEGIDNLVYSFLKESQKYHESLAKSIEKSREKDH